MALKVYISFKIAKIIVVVTIVEFCEGGAVGWGGVARRGRLILEENSFQVSISIFKNIYSFNVIMTGCLLGIKDQRIVCYEREISS